MRHASVAPRRSAFTIQLDQKILHGHAVSRLNMHRGNLSVTLDRNVGFRFRRFQYDQRLTGCDPAAPQRSRPNPA
jgi:hypothetical protein